MAKLVEAVDAGRLETPRGTSTWFEPRVTVQAIRTLPGGGWTIPGRCDAVVSVMSPAGTTLDEVRESIDAFLRSSSRRTARCATSSRCCPMGAGRLWLRPGESDPEAPGVKALEQAVADVRGEAGEVRKFNGGWVDAVELMRTGPDGFEHAGGDHLRTG